ncbi:MAG: hypothetical protein LKI94_01000 [Sporolactobacillus sp.]|nr:hypothetical protein [Sporolactobacillus sp.]
MQPERKGMTTVLRMKPGRPPAVRQSSRMIHVSGSRSDSESAYLFNH